MDQHYQRETALALLCEFTTNEALRRHAYAVESAMRLAAERLGEDADEWAAVGLLHDLDYELFPSPPEHPLKGGEILRARGYPESFVRAVLSHGDETGVPRDTACARWLYAVDELSGFCMACAMVQPDRKIASVKVASVAKKLKRKEFAAKVSREQIALGAAALGLPLDELIAHVLAALTRVGDQLGL